MNTCFTALIGDRAERLVRQKASQQREQHVHRQQPAGEAQVIRKAEPRAGSLVAYLWN
jgi:hypothetical protein